jgi:hypothetical protein
MRKYAGLMVLMLAIALGAFTAFATSMPSFSETYGPAVAARVMSISGDTVMLYYGGPLEESVFCRGETVPIFEPNVLQGSVRRIGEVKITSLVSTRYVQSKLVSGDADLGYIASKPNALCLEGYI